MSELFPSAPKVGGALRRAARCIGRGLRKLGRAMLYILPALVLIHLIAVVVTGRQLQGDIDRLTKAGVIVPAKDLIPTLPPGAENAADVYEQAWSALRLSTEDETALFDQGVKHDAKWFALARQVVAANPEYYRLIYRASGIQHCVFKVGWDFPLEASFAHFGHMRKDARMLTLRCNVEAADGRPDNALGSVAVMVRVGQQAKTDPVIIAELVSYAIQGMGVGSLEDVLAKGSPSPGACRSLRDQLAKIDNTSSSVRAMKGEFVLCGMDVFGRVRSGQVSLAQLASLGSDASAPRWWRRLAVRTGAWLLRPLLNADERVYLSYMEREVRAFERPWPDSKRIMSEQEDWLDRRGGTYAIVTNMVAPVLSRFGWFRDRATAAIGTARIAIALRAYRAEHGSYPVSLAELEPEGWKPPLDPFGGKPYRYRREGSGFVVWSIGPDMRDQNASIDYETWLKTKLQKGWEEGEYDIVFRCSR